jgi:hypothetical protein
MTGIVIASSSVMIARLSDGEDKQDGGLKIDHDEGSWIGSLTNIYDIYFHFFYHKKYVLVKFLPVF